MELSIVLPTYKEKDNLSVLIPQIELVFKDYFFEIIVVDDNSSDGTETLIRELQNKFQNIRLLNRPRPAGIGSALRDGYNLAQGKFIISSDADLSFETEDMLRLYRKINEGYDLVIGSRHGSGGIYECKSFITKAKYYCSKLGNIFVKRISGLPLNDVSANFRAIKQIVWRNLKTKEKTNFFLFEMIAIAVKKKFVVTDLPVAFHERKFGQSKLAIGREIPKFLIKFILYSIRQIFDFL